MAINKYDYLTEHEKRLVGCIEYIPSEYSEDDIYSEDDTSELEFLDDIFNIRY